MRIIQIAIVATTLIFAVLVIFALRSRSIVIGSQIANAQAQERAHRRRIGNVPSPLPKQKYDQRANVLIDARVSDLDRQLAMTCRDFAVRTTEGRAMIRDAATTADFYELLRFARRASLFAIREGSEHWLRDGLTAVAIVDPKRIDERDIPLTLSIIYYAAERIGANAPTLFDSVAALAEPYAAQIIRGFPRRPADYKSIKSWGYEEVAGPAGTMFVRYGFQPYAPTQDLLARALAVRSVIERGPYSADVTVASNLPAVWFPASRENVVKDILARARGTVSVDGNLLPTAHDQPDSQMLMVFIVQTQSDQDAALLRGFGTAEVNPGIAKIAIHRNDLFLLIIARSVFEGVPAYETQQSIARLYEPCAVALESPAAPGG